MGIPATLCWRDWASVVHDVYLFNHTLLAYVWVFIDVSHAREINEDNKIGLEKGFYRSSFKASS